MSKPHATLRPATNIVMIIVWGIAALLLTRLCNPRPILLLDAGSALGVVGGYMQVLSFGEGRDAFLQTNTALEVRARLKATKWGKRYLYFLWSSGFFLVVLAFLLTSNPALAFPAAYFTMMFVREIVTLKPTFDLARMSSQEE